MTDAFLTVAEVAELLKLNQQTVRNWIDRGELPAVRLGARRVRVRQSELDRFIAAGETTTALKDQDAGTPDATAEQRQRLREAIVEVSTALDGDHVQLDISLDALISAARAVSEALERDRPS